MVDSRNSSTSAAFLRRAFGTAFAPSRLIGQVLRGQKRRPSRNGIGIGIETLENRHLLAGHPIITEFMAKNNGVVEDGDDNASDWIEVQNIGDEAIDLVGYRLTDSLSDLSRWSFPNVIVEPGASLVVFASGQATSDYVDAGGHLHTNFKLSAGGEVLALVAPDGSILSQFGDSQSNYVPQLADVSYGVAQRQVVLTEQSESKFWVPDNGDVDSVWTKSDFDAEAHGFSTGTASLGFEGHPDSRSNIAGAFITELSEDPIGVYARMEFELEKASDVSQLRLQMNFDDGFIAYLNGTKIAEENAPAVSQWASGATTRRSDRRAMSDTEYDVTPFTPLLIDGTNLLAIHGLNHSADLSSLLLVPELTATVNSDDAKVGHMTAFSPGSANVGDQGVYTGFLSETPQIDVPAGFYDDPFSVTISSDVPDAQLRYTTDGSPPTATTGTEYTGPIQIKTTTTLRAALFQPDHIPTRVSTHSYIFLQDVIRQSQDQPNLPTRWVQQTGCPCDFEADY